MLASSQQRTPAFLAGTNSSACMSVAGRCADNAMGAFSGRLTRDRVGRQVYWIRGEAGADVFDYIERYHNPHRQRRLEVTKQKELLLVQPIVATERCPV